MMDERNLGESNELVQFTQGELPRLFTGIRNRKKREWLAAVATTGRILESQRLTGIDRRFHYLWLEKDPDYPAAFERAKEMACDNAEDEVYRRGFQGYERSLSYQGKLTGDKIKEYSDTCAALWLNGARPEKYRYTKTEHSGTVQHAHAVFVKDMTDDDLRAFIGKRLERGQVKSGENG